MNYEALTKRAGYFKQDAKGAANICKIMEKIRNEAARKTTLENAHKLLKLGS